MSSVACVAELYSVLRIRWQDRVRNIEISDRTGLPTVGDLISKRRHAIFSHVARLSTTAPVNQALKLQVDLSLNRPPSAVCAVGGWINFVRRITFQLACGVLPSGKVIPERRYGPRWLRVNDDYVCNHSACIDQHVYPGHISLHMLAIKTVLIYKRCSSLFLPLHCYSLQQFTHFSAHFWLVLGQNLHVCNTFVTGCHPILLIHSDCHVISLLFTYFVNIYIYGYLLLESFHVQFR